jgi:hypothetical protein
MHIDSIPANQTIWYINKNWTDAYCVRFYGEATVWKIHGASSPDTCMLKLLLPKETKQY